MMIRRAIFLLPLLVCDITQALAAPASGTYGAGEGRLLSIASAASSTFSFALLVGVADGETSCEEGDVSCLAVTGEAVFQGDRYVDEDPNDRESRIVFVGRPGGVEIETAQGNLGIGSGNASQLGRIAGLYQPAQTSGSATPDVVFQTPSGNIICYLSVSDAYIRCDMGELKMTYTQRPEDCDLDWGHVFGIAAAGTRGEAVCYGDTLFGTKATTLGYGGELSAGGFVCRSEKSGLTCRNASGHGFMLSKARQELF